MIPAQLRALVRCQTYWHERNTDITRTTAKDKKQDREEGATQRALDGKAAEWVFSLGGMVKIVDVAGQRDAHALKDLPDRTA